MNRDCKLLTGPSTGITLSALLCFLMLTGLANAASGNLRITPEQVRFTYQSFDGEWNLPCKASIEDSASQDWKVLCTTQNPAPASKLFRVHLWVKRYERATKPNLSFEILYWVMDRTPGLKRPEGTGSSTWIHLNKLAPLASLQLSQSVEKDTAGLYLEIRPIHESKWD